MTDNGNRASSCKNLIAIAKKNGNGRARNSHFNDDRCPSLTNLTVGCMIYLSGQNIKPEWGLYHGSMGKIIDIVFAPNESPNNGCLPLYVIVEFDHYCGPTFDKNNPKYVPIIPMETFCNFKCCTRRYVPLIVAYGKTIHTFQGQNVGPVNEGQQQNSIKRILVDPGTRSFEALSAGLFYSLLSRVSTLGNQTDKLSSAIYFTGSNMSESRIQNIILKKDNQIYETVKRRKTWVSYLKSNEEKTKFLNKTKECSVINWAQTTKLTKQQVHALFEE